MMKNLEESTLQKLKLERRKKTVKKFVALTVAIIFLGLITPILLVVLSIILMLAGVSAMYNLGFLTRREEMLNDANTWFEKSFYQGIILSVSGLLLFFLTLYIMSVGWKGLLGFI